MVVVLVKNCAAPANPLFACEMYAHDVIYGV